MAINMSSSVQLSKQASVRGFLPIFTFLGKLVDALPALAQTLACHHGNEPTHRHVSYHK